MISLNGKVYECPSKIPLDLVDEKWKFLILWNLAFKALRISELSEKISDISQRTLSRKLKALEEVSLVKRVVFAEVPPRVEYSLTIHEKDYSKYLKWWVNGENNMQKRWML